MSKTIFVRPLGGRKVRNPDQGFRHLPDAGDTVTPGAYWQNLKDEGAVEIFDRRPAAKPEPLKGVAKSKT